MKSITPFGRFAVLGIAFVVHAEALGATWYVSVPPCNSDSATCGTSEANTCCRIQDAVSRSANGDTVLVKPGTYVQSDGITNFVGKAITVKSTAGPEVTTITATNGAPKVKFQSGEGSASILEGFTLSGGTGVGVFCVIASPTIRGNIIADNGDSGIRLINSSAIIEDNLICGNTATTGGGIYAQDPTNLVIRRCTITGNSATENYYNVGGGLRLTGGGSVTVSRCVVRDNEGVGYGGGMATNDVASIAGPCPALLTVNVDNTLFFGNTSTQQSGGGMSIGNCTMGTASHVTFSRNDALTGPAMYVFNGGGTYTVTESILWGNAVPGDTKSEITIHTGSLVVSYSDVEGGFAGVGNINADPLFFDPAADNYHIKTGSPAMNAAVGCDLAGVDLDGHPRCVNGVEDMGAYEYPECLTNANCDDGQACNGVETCVTGVCQRTALVDCNCNGVHDDCDISRATSDDCNLNGTPDECEGGSPFPAQVAGCSIEHGRSLWRSEKNYLKLTFSCDITDPVADTQLKINKMLSGGQFDTAELAGAFAIDVLLDSNNRPRILTIKREPLITLQHQTWYGVRGTSSWTNVVPFTLHYVNMIGDADANNFVTPTDVSLINGNQGPQPEDSRYDINGDRFTTATDVSLANSHIGPPPAKPSGHATCAVCCPPL